MEPKSSYTGKLSWTVTVKMTSGVSHISSISPIQLNAFRKKFPEKLDMEAPDILNKYIFPLVKHDYSSVGTIVSINIKSGF